MQFKSFVPGIEVSGGVVQTVVEAFALTPSIATGFLKKHNIVRAEGQVNIDPEAWYSLDDWLACYEAISRAGGKSLFYIGTCIPRTAKLPPLKDLEHAIQAMDVGYHMNHRRGGKVMFDPATGTMLDGIGNYTATRLPNENTIVSVCKNPYPCDFDHGILTGFAHQFAKNAKVTHDDTAPCRKKGADSCTYTVKW
jgi:hypothetical protein